MHLQLPLLPHRDDEAGAGNLDSSEIVGQMPRDALGQWPSEPEGRMLTNIVMGKA